MHLFAEYQRSSAADNTPEKYRETHNLRCSAGRSTEAMLRYAELAKSDPEELKALRNLFVKHLDETHAARNINVRWQPDKAEAGEAG